MVVWQFVDVGALPKTLVTESRVSPTFIRSVRSSAIALVETMLMTAAIQKKDNEITGFLSENILVSITNPLR